MADEMQRAPDAPPDPRAMSAPSQARVPDARRRQPGHQPQQARLAAAIGAGEHQRAAGLRARSREPGTPAARRAGRRGRFRRSGVGEARGSAATGSAWKWGMRSADEGGGADDATGAAAHHRSPGPQKRRPRGGRAGAVRTSGRGRDRCGERRRADVVSRPSYEHRECDANSMESWRKGDFSQPGGCRPGSIVACARPRSPCRRWAGCPARASSTSPRSLVTAARLSARRVGEGGVGAGADLRVQRHDVALARRG